MRVSCFVGALVIASAALVGVVSAQSPALASPPLTLKLVSPSVESAMAAIAGASGVTVQIDEGVPAEVRARPLVSGPLSLVNAPLEAVLELLTSQNGLTFVVVDARNVRIQVKPR